MGVEEQCPPDPYLQSTRFPSCMQDFESGIVLDGVEVAIIVEQKDVVFDRGGGDHAVDGSADSDAVPP
jgi:hypothetical protein